MLGSARGARPPCPRVGCSRGGQRAPHWEQTSHPRPLHAHSLFGTPAAPGPRTRAPATWPAVLLLAFELFTRLCCFRNRLKILKNLTRQEVAVEIDQRGTGSGVSRVCRKLAGYSVASLTDTSPRDEGTGCKRQAGHVWREVHERGPAPGGASSPRARCPVKTPPRALLLLPPHRVRDRVSPDQQLVMACCLVPHG